MINTIILGHALNVLPQLPAESVSCVTTSPPYWGLRDYGIEPVIWDAPLTKLINCQHNFSIETKAGDIRFRGINSMVGSERNPKVWEGDGKGQFCQLCGAWKGSLGLEPTIELYIKHLCDIFDEVKRVLRKDGTCFVDLGDSYGQNYRGGKEQNEWHKQKRSKGEIAFMGKKKPDRCGIPDKSLCLIPQRFVIEMVTRGWIARNEIIWHKPNCMPESATDRFTVDFESVFYFSKNNKTLFWTNEKTLECVSKKPLGIKGIEGKDWEWRPCPACSNKDYFNVRTRDVTRKEKDCPQFKASNKEKENIKNKICPRCKGLKKVKYSLWTGHNVFFEQQFEDLLLDSLKRERRAFNKKDKPYKVKKQRGNVGYEGIDEEYETTQGRNKRCVWKIPTKSFKEAHFATFPEALIEPIIRAGCPEFVCKKCGKARVKIYEKGDLKKSGKGHISYGYKGNSKHQKVEKSKISSWSQNFVKDNLIPGMAYEQKFKGYSDCGCNAGFEPGVDLDPFMGAGTSALVALKQRKRFIGIEIKKEYIDMSYKRIKKVQQKIF